jgi:hypothetical protein
MQDQISLELARRTAQRLRAQPELVAVARANLQRWSQRNGDSPALLRCYAEWQAILDRPLDEVIAILLDPSDEGQRLRQNSRSWASFAPTKCGRSSAKREVMQRHQLEHIVRPAA